MPDAATLMTPKARDLLQKQERSASVVGFEEAVVDFFVDAADLLGVPKSVAVLYGIVFASPQPLSFADIQARGTLSKGSVSQGLRVLREMGAIKEVSAPADRSELFTPDLEMRRLIQRFLEQRLEKQLAAGKSRLGDLQRALQIWRNPMRRRFVPASSSCNPGMRKPGRCCRSPGRF